MTINKAFFEKHDVDLDEKDAVKAILKATKRLLKDCYNEEKYPTTKAKFFEIVEDFKEATM